MLNFYKYSSSLLAYSRFIVTIPKNKLIARYSRSSGPGGQSVNKSETKVQLRFHIDTADWLEDEIKENLKIVCKNKISSKGEFIVESDVHSSRIPNYNECVKYIRNALEDAENYKPKEHLSFLEQIENKLSQKQILNYKLRRKEERIKTKTMKRNKKIYSEF